MRTLFPTFVSFMIFMSLGFTQPTEKEHLNQLMDNWHTAAANADQQSYFDFLAVDAVYIGTDATENWTKQEFFEWSKSYFENGKAWSFIAKERNIYFSNDKSIVWFDEQLEFSGGILRGSGVLVKGKSDWKLRHYVLSLPVPNDKFNEVVKVIKKEGKPEMEEPME